MKKVAIGLFFILLILSSWVYFSSDIVVLNSLRWHECDFDCSDRRVVNFKYKGRAFCLNLVRVRRKLGLDGMWGGFPSSKDGYAAVSITFDDASSFPFNGNLASFLNVTRVNVAGDKLEIFGGDGAATWTAECNIINSPDGDVTFLLDSVHDDRVFLRVRI